MGQVLVNFSQAYWGSIATCVLLIAILAILYKKGKKDLVKTIILDLVHKAEYTYGSGTGTLKYAAVVNALYDKLPLIARLLFTKEDIKTYIDAALHYLEKQFITPVAQQQNDDAASKPVEVTETTQ